MLGRQHRLEAGERVEPLALGLVVGPSQAADWTLVHVICKGFRKVEFVLHDRSAEEQTRRFVRYPNEMAVLAAKSGKKIHHPIVPTAGGRLGLDGRQAA